MPIWHKIPANFGFFIQSYIPLNTIDQHSANGIESVSLPNDEIEIDETQSKTSRNKISETTFTQGNLSLLEFRIFDNIIFIIQFDLDLDFDFYLQISN